jgi:hypothetical protein
LYDFSENAGNPLTNPEAKVKLSVFDMKRYFADHDMKLGDGLIMKVEDFLKGRLTVRPVSAERLKEEQPKVLRWCALFSEGLEKALKSFDEETPLYIEDELTMAFLWNRDYLLRNPVIHVGGFLALSKKFILTDIDGYGIIWPADTPVPTLSDIDEDQDEFDDLFGDYDDGFFDDFDDLALPPAPPEKGAVLEDFLRYLGFDLTVLELEEYMRDELHRGGDDPERVWLRCFDGRVADMLDDVKREKEFRRLFDELWKRVYNERKAIEDDGKAEIRALALEIKDKLLAWAREFGDAHIPLERLTGTEEFLHLTLTSKLVSETLNILGTTNSLTQKELRRLAEPLHVMQTTVPTNINNVMRKLNEQHE